MSVLQFLTTVHFDYGARSQLPALLLSRGVRRPLLVTDKGVAGAGVFSKALEALSGSVDLPVFDNVPVNPTEAAALSGARMYTDQGCDGIVGIGGGAVLDLAKGIAILATNPPPLWDYCNRHPQPRAIRNAPPLVLLPTTAGTGSEVGRSAVIVFDNGVKAGVRCPELVTAAICDPDLTLALPPSITASTGLDALSHCIETYCSPVINPPADAISLDGMRRIFANIETAVRVGRDRSARWNMMMGSLEGAISFQKGMGSVHALSHALGARGFHHGTLNAILLPGVLAANRPWLQEKWETMNRQRFQPAESELDAGIMELNRRIGIPTRLRDIGVTRGMLNDTALRALDDNAHKTNPRPMTAADYCSILEAAY